MTALMHDYDWHSERMWYSMLELGVKMTFPDRDFCKVLDAFQTDGEWFIRLGFEWESIGHFELCKEWR
tara:strand:+ start:392 stop:595 length:204 start_codon:yes stop_codon:yes gene_type:complete